VRKTLNGRVIWALQVTASPPTDVANGLRAKLTGHTPVKTSLGGMSADEEALGCGREAWMASCYLAMFDDAGARGRLPEGCRMFQRGTVPQHSGTAKATTSRECM
jgi:hypothetical protein